jgi:hypothetical protein
MIESFLTFGDYLFDPATTELPGLDVFAVTAQSGESARFLQFVIMSIVHRIGVVLGSKGSLRISGASRVIVGLFRKPIVYQLS